MHDEQERVPTSSEPHQAGDEGDQPTQPTAAGSGSEDGPTSAERLAGVAREQAEEAAHALRRGEFMRDVSVDPTADSDDRLIALLCYVSQILIPLILPVLVLLSESSRKRPFQRFHAVQSLALMLVFVVLGVLVAVATTILAMIPLVGWLVALVIACLSPVALLMVYLALVYYGYQAYQGKRFAIPGLTRFLQDQGWLPDSNERP